MLSLRRLPASQPSCTRITSSPATDGGDNTSGVCWGDYDNNGDDDLFVANLSGQRNALYHNDAGRFVDTAGEFAAGGDSYSCSWGDYDNDGDLDLFVTSGKFSQPDEVNFLYRNNGNGTFSSVPKSTFSSETGYAVGSAWGD